MSIKVLVVDDEPMICKGLRLTIPWAQMGAEVREAYDGAQALQMMEEAPADLILTDVRMPRKNGLELAEQLHDRQFTGKIVMLSGYEEFAYVKKALHFGVKDYLLKPVDADELIALLGKLLLEIGEEKQRKEAHKLETYYRYIAKEMIENAGKDESPLPGPSSSCRFIISRIGEYYRWMNQTSKPQQDRMRARWKDIVDGAFHRAALPTVSLFLQQNLLLTVVPETEQACITGDAISRIMDGCCVQELVPGHRLEWLVSDRANAMLHVKANVQLMTRLLQQGVNGAAKLSLGVTQLREEMPRIRCADYPKQTEQELLKLLFEYKEEELRGVVRQLFEHFGEQRYALQDAYLVCQEMYTMVERRFRATAGLKELSGGMPNMKNADLQVYNSFDAIEHLFTQSLTTALELLKQANFGKNRPIIDWAKAYIGKNYSLQLKSYEMADRLRVTPNYFSSIFKQETGKSFNEYVNEIRIEKAKELLVTTSELVGTIAMTVGYKEYKYFSNIFKKYCGFVPTEYRDLHRKTL